MEDFRQEVPFENLQERTNMTTRIALVFLLNNNDTNMYSNILACWENGILLNKLFMGGRTHSHPPKRIAHPKVCPNCKGKDTRVRCFSAFLRVFGRDFFEEMPCKS